MSRDHEKLAVFGLAETVALEIYRITSSFPLSERYGLQSQLRRAAVSTASNIVEGCARRNPREYAHFINIAVGSSAEAEFLLSFSIKLGFINDGESATLRDRLNHLVRSLKSLRRSLQPRMSDGSL